MRFEESWGVNDERLIAFYLLVVSLAQFVWQRQMSRGWSLVHSPPPKVGLVPVAVCILLALFSYDVDW